MFSGKSAAICAAACLAIAPMASAATYTFQDGVGGYDGTQDLRILAGSESLYNTGGDQTISPAYSGKALLRFDNIGVLTGKTIQSATVTLYTSISSYGSAGATDPVSLYQMPDANVGWQQGTGVYPAAATAGEACYDYLSYDPVSPVAWPDATGLQYWTSEGMLTSLNTQNFPYQTDGTPITFTLPASLVQQWVAGTNPGLVIDSSVYENGIYFKSSEFTNTAWRPLLTVETAPVPEPASMAVLGMIGLGLIARRRRA